MFYNDMWFTINGLAMTFYAMGFILWSANRLLAERIDWLERCEAAMFLIAAGFTITLMIGW